MSNVLYDQSFGDALKPRTVTNSTLLGFLNRNFDEDRIRNIYYVTDGFVATAINARIDSQVNLRPCIKVQIQSQVKPETEKGGMSLNQGSFA